MFYGHPEEYSVTSLLAPRLRGSRATRVLRSPTILLQGLLEQLFALRPLCFGGPSIYRTAHASGVLYKLPRGGSGAVCRATWQTASSEVFFFSGARLRDQTFLLIAPEMDAPEATDVASSVLYSLA
jgi:hypothetical protein